MSAFIPHGVSMDIRQLRYFVAIAENGSFSRAAETLHVAQPGLSLHMRNMEEALGTKLLFRTPRGVVLTEAGSILLRHARNILQQLMLAETEIRSHEDVPSGEVRLGLPGTISEILSVPLIRTARHRYPSIKLRILEGMSGFVLEWLRDSRVDLAVLYSSAEDPAIRTLKLLTETLVFLGPAKPDGGSGLPPSGQAVTFEALTGKPLILPSRGHGLRDHLDRTAAAAGHELTTVVDVDSYSNIKDLSAEGFGFSILPEHAVSRDAAAGRLATWPIRDPWLRRDVYLAHAIDRPIAKSVKVVRDIAIATLIDLANSGQWVGATTTDDLTIAG